jgi:apolipoprotein N-acyltransferase
VRLALAVLAGGLLLAAPPPYDLWWAAPLGVAALTVAVSEVSLRRSYLLAVVAHLALFLPLLEWTRFLGPVPWLLLAVLQALVAGLVGPLTTLARRALPLAALPVALAGAWVAVEAVRGRVPYGGFTWGRLAFGQTDGPGLGLAAVGGAPLVTAVTAAAGAALLVLAHAVRRRRPGLGAAGVLALLLPLLGLLVSPPTADRTLGVAAVQGNVPEGLTGLGEDREVLANHVEQTLRLVADVRAGRREEPDLVVWPENAVDQDPRLDPSTDAALEDARRALGAPFVVGAVLRSGERLENSIFVWDGEVPAVRYAKQHLVPFGEYLPHRALVERLYPAASSLLPRDFAPGDRVGTLDVAGARLAVGTCYEVAFDDLPREAVRAGGEILVLPSNNASYGRSAESAQQLAMARLRAVEHGRAAVVATTSGISALVEPDGRVVARSGLFEPSVLDAELPLSRTLTRATRSGPAVEAALAALGLLAAAGGARSALARVGAGVRRRR